MRTAPQAVGPATGPLTGSVRVPGDKSISHRMAMLAAVGWGDSVLRGFSDAGDCEATLSVLLTLGIPIERRSDAVVVRGRNWSFFEPAAPLDCGRSGTTMRLVCGLLASSERDVILTGDPQLLARPMERVAEPLRRMGVQIETTDGRPPISMVGGALSGIEYELPVASAQVKSAILLAGLRAEGTTTVVERVSTRDHTERLLRWLGYPIEVEDGGRRISVQAVNAPLSLGGADVPGDFSSAAPLLAAASLVPGSEFRVEDVGLNPTRTAFLDVLGRMGGRVETDPRPDEGPEPIGTVTVRHAELRGTEVPPEEVPRLIDELPLLGVLGALAEGTTVVRGAQELRVKESDRISLFVAGLRALGAEIEELPDGFAVTGPVRLRAGAVDAGGDHRLAMAFSVAALAADGPVMIEGLDSVRDSFPGFLETLESLR